MKWAVIGAGLAGLALTTELLERGLGEVTLFDAEGVGAGASGACAGLLHPYPGEQFRLSDGAREAMKATKRLIALASAAMGEPVARFDGILRLALKETQRALFEERELLNSDLHSCDVPACYRAHKAIEIAEGGVVFMKSYLEGLFRNALNKGLHFEKRLIENPLDLDFDHTFICTGYGTFRFPFAEDLPLKAVKGQALLCRGEVEKPVIGKGHITPTESAGIIQLGSTYEHQFNEVEPDLVSAKERILPMITSFFPQASDLEIVGCRSGVRVTKVGHYYPIVKRISKRATLVTGLGSRGLLYHATVALQAIENALC